MTYKPLYHALMRKYGQAARPINYIGALPADHERRMATNPVYRAQVEQMMARNAASYNQAAQKRQIIQDFKLDGQSAAPITQEYAQRPHTGSQGDRTRDFQRDLDGGITAYTRAANAHDDYVKGLKDADKYTLPEVQRHNDRIAQLRARRDTIGRRIGTNPRDGGIDNFEARRRGFMMGDSQAPTGNVNPQVDPRVRAEQARAIQAAQAGTYGNVGQGQVTRFSARNQLPVPPAPPAQPPAQPPTQPSAPVAPGPTISTTLPQGSNAQIPPATPRGQVGGAPLGNTTLPPPSQSQGGEAPGAAAERQRQRYYASQGGEAPGAAAERARQQRHANSVRSTALPRVNNRQPAAIPRVDYAKHRRRLYG